MHRRLIRFVFILNSFLLTINSSYSQIEIRTHFVANIDTVIEVNVPSNMGVMFFLPINNEKKENYEKRIQELAKELENSKLYSLELKVYYYELNEKNLKKGIKIKDVTSSFLYEINQFECFLQGFDTVNLNRAINISTVKFGKEYFGFTNKLHKIQVADPHICFGKLSDRIPAYTPLIMESIFPKYSSEEKIDLLKDSISSLINEIENLKTQVNMLSNSILEIQHMNKKILDIILNDEPKKKTDKK